MTETDKISEIEQDTAASSPEELDEELNYVAGGYGSENICPVCRHKSYLPIRHICLNCGWQG